MVRAKSTTEGLVWRGDALRESEVSVAKGKLRYCSSSPLFTTSSLAMKGRGVQRGCFEGEWRRKKDLGKGFLDPSEKGTKCYFREARKIGREKEMEAQMEQAEEGASEAC